MSSFYSDTGHSARWHLTDRVPHDPELIEHRLPELQARQQSVSPSQSDDDRALARTTDVTSRLVEKYFEIAEQVVNGQIGVNRAHAAIRALNSVVQKIRVVS